MTYDEFNRFCKSLKGSTYVSQWGQSHVWKGFRYMTWLLWRTRR